MVKSISYLILLKKIQQCLLFENVGFTTDDNSPKEKLTLEQKKIIEKLYKEVNS